MSDTAILEQAQQDLDQMRAQLPTMPEVRRAGDGIDLTPVTHRWTCPYCKRGFESEGIRGFKAPPQMVCAECTGRYEAKVMEEFALTEAQKEMAYNVSRLDRKSPDRKATIELWKILGDEKASIFDRLKYRAMIDLVHRVDRGLASAPAKQEKAKRAW